MKKCEFCGKYYLFSPKNAKGTEGILSLCNHCFDSFWCGELTVEKKQYLARYALSGGVSDEKKRIIVSHLRNQEKQMAVCSTSLQKESIGFMCGESNDISECRTPHRETGFLCGKAYDIGGLKIKNPCIFISKKRDSYSINENSIEQSISLSDEEFEAIRVSSFNKKDLFDFEPKEVSYFLMWLAKMEDYPIIPEHCYSRYFDGLFYRALKQKKNQIEIIDKVVELIKTSNDAPRNDRNVVLLRFIFAILEDCDREFSRTQKTLICEKIKDLFGFHSFYLKQGWDWDPVSWYLKNDLMDYIPEYLVQKAILAKNESSGYIYALTLAEKYKQCELKLKGENPSMPLCLNGMVNTHYIKDFHEDRFEYKTKGWNSKGSSFDRGTYDDMDSYFMAYYNSLSQMLMDGNGKRLIYFWLMMPHVYQKNVSMLFVPEIEKLIGKEMTVGGLLSFFDISVGEKQKNLWVVNDSQIFFIKSSISDYGLSLVFEEPESKLKISSKCWILKEEDVEVFKREQIENSSSLFVFDEAKKRITGLTPKGYTQIILDIPIKNANKNALYKISVNS